MIYLNLNITARAGDTKWVVSATHSNGKLEVFEFDSANDAEDKAVELIKEGW